MNHALGIVGKWLNAGVMEDGSITHSGVEAEDKYAIFKQLHARQRPLDRDHLSMAHVPMNNGINCAARDS